VSIMPAAGLRLVVRVHRDSISADSRASSWTFEMDGKVVGIEILYASKRVRNPRSFEYAVAG
jgi:hypothetical protein